MIWGKGRSCERRPCVSHVSRTRRTNRKGGALFETEQVTGAANCVHAAPAAQPAQNNARSILTTRPEDLPTVATAVVRQLLQAGLQELVPCPLFFSACYCCYCHCCCCCRRCRCFHRYHESEHGFVPKMRPSPHAAKKEPFSCSATPPRTFHTHPTYCTMSGTRPAGCRSLSTSQSAAQPIITIALSRQSVTIVDAAALTDCALPAYCGFNHTLASCSSYYLPQLGAVLRTAASLSCASV